MESNTDGMPDLLSAVLNESGLMSCDLSDDGKSINEDKYGNQNDLLLQALQSSVINTAKENKSMPVSEKTYEGAVLDESLISKTVPGPPTSTSGHKTNSFAIAKSITVAHPTQTVLLSKASATCKVTAIPHAKIIKLPTTLKAGSIIKINKLGKSNIISPSVIRPVNPSSSSSSVAKVNTTVDFSKAQTAKPATSNISAISRNPSSNPEVKFKKVVMGDKTILIPVCEQHSINRTQPNTTAMSQSQVLLPKAKIMPITSTTIASIHSTTPLTKSISLDGSNCVPSCRSNFHHTPSVTPTIKLSLATANHKTMASKQPSSNLNLGSMFVENAEKAVDSDFDTPPGSPFAVVMSNGVDKNSHASKTTNPSTLIQSTPKFSVYASRSMSLNGKTSLQNCFRISSTNSIPTIDLRGNSSPTVVRAIDKLKSLGKDGLLRSISVPTMQIQPGEDLVAEDEKEEESELQHVQTYAEYKPSKLMIGLPHPDSVVETSSLSSIMPPDVQYRLNIPRQTIDHGQLSALQLESIVYACQKHQLFLPGGERAGFLIGDGAGVGKGRSVAGVIFENYLAGRKRALWFSVSNDLKYDAERDLRDIGAKHIKVYSLNKFKYGKITAKNNGSVKKGVIFGTYSSLIGESHSQAKYHTRLKQILHWCGEDFDGPIIFDECHKAKNLVPSGAGKSTKTGITVLELQKLLPKARVVYASATGASEPRNMAYMSRLGLWGEGTPFPEFMDFIQAVERRGVGAMELVAMDMKLRGCYIARQLSFYGVSFKINEVTLDPSFIVMYNQAVKLWVMAREAFQAAASMIDAEYHMKKTMWAQFWAAHQRFFKYLCMSAKVKHTVALVREAVKHGKCVVIGMQSTGEAGTADQLEKCGGELDDFVSTAKTVLENLIEKHFPAPNRKRVVELLGHDLYKRNNSQHGNKRKLPINGKDPPVAKRQKRDSESSEDGNSSTSESANEEDAASNFSDEDHLSDASVVSDEDIGKIFGDGSDSEENESPVKKKRKNRRKSSENLSANDDDDSGLQLEDLKKLNAEKQVEEMKRPGLLGSLDLVSGTIMSDLPGMGSVDKAHALKQELQSKLETIASILPNNVLDELIDALGGPENVAEMTGRKGRVVSTDEGNVEYQTRAENDVPVELLNLTEKQRFMDGEKNIAIISEAASSGISLQADKRARNQRRRVHVTLELPWSADRAIQQFGRTHRSNQVNAPEYVFLITELAGEQRFASVVAKRLESLGALTHGDRRATETRDLSKYNYDNKYGRKALDSVMKAIAGYDAPLVAPPISYKGDFFKDIRQALLGVGMITRETGHHQYQLDKDYNNIFKFMNRMLGMEVDQQNGLFAFFSDTLKAIVQEAKRLGEYDQGIVDVGAGSNSVERVKCRNFPIALGGTVSLHTVRVERGTSWQEAQKIADQSSEEEDSGFYVTFQKRNGKNMVMLAREFPSRRRAPPTFTIFRPNTGKQMRRETLEDIKKKYHRCDADEAEKWWSQQHAASLDHCSHVFWQGKCTRGSTTSCHVGKRRRTYHVLGGSVLGVWKTVEHVLSIDGGMKYKMQIVRLKTSDDGKLVGLLIPSICVNRLITALEEESAHAQSQPLNNNSVYANSHDPDISDDTDDYEDVDDIEPDEMLSSVLFSKQNPWT